MPACGPGCPSRYAFLHLSIGGWVLDRVLGGVFKSTVLHNGITDEGIKEDELNEEDELLIRWESAFFFGHHWFLGDILITLNPSNGKSIGTVISAKAANQQAGPGRFYPAFSENQFFFNIKIPRFRLHWVNNEPLENSAIIHGIPPLGIPYRLKKRVRFKPQSWLNIPLDVLACAVVMMGKEKIGVDISRSEVIGDKLEIEVELVNKTAAGKIRVVWIAEAPDGIEPSRRAGIMWLRKKPRRTKITFSRTSFHGQGKIKVSSNINYPLSIEAKGCDFASFTFN